MPWPVRLGHDIAVDSRSHVFVVDVRGHRVRKLRPMDERGQNNRE
ncbi:hypothetical protein [Myxococcus stipitatus]